MTDTLRSKLDGVAETMLIPLYLRAKETKRPDSMLKDEKAAALVEKIDYDFSRIKLMGHDEVALILRLREFDRFARDFMENNSSPVIVHIGCGLDTRFERVDDGRVEWYDLDLPDVIDLRRRLIREEGERYHLLSGSVFDFGWIEKINDSHLRPFLFLAEGVFPYFKEAQIKSLVLSLKKHFPGSELVCDAHTPFAIWADNLQLASSKINARLHWGLKHGKDVEKWGDGISLLDEWFYFDTAEPRVRPFRWMRKVPLIGKSTGIFHYRLG